MILGFCGSPRPGATEYMIKEALRMIEMQGHKTEFYTIKDKEIRYCIHCDFCLQKRGCILNDDLGLLYELLKEAEGIIIGSPVYNGGITAQTKTVLDRTRALVAADPKVFEGKKGIAVAIGGDRIGGAGTGNSADHKFLSFEWNHSFKWRFFWGQYWCNFLVERYARRRKRGRRRLQNLKKDN
jgi:multimeric flavodoxin WrbA